MELERISHSALCPVIILNPDHHSARRPDMIPNPDHHWACCPVMFSESDHHPANLQVIDSNRHYLSLTRVGSKIFGAR